MEKQESLESEKDVFSRMKCARFKCLNFLSDEKLSKKLDEANLAQRVQDIVEWEKLLLEMWIRLEMDARKGDPSEVLKSKRTPEENWIVERVFPGLILPDLLEMLGNSQEETSNVEEIS